MKKKINILSIDGGGIRGIIPAVVLDYIEQGLQRKSNNPNVTLADYFDLIAGTSTGGILACFYLLPPDDLQFAHSKYYAKDAIRIYAEYGKKIFRRPWYRLGLTSERYPSDGLESVLKEFMGDVTLAETRKHCLVTAYNITEREAVFFSTPEAKKYRHRNYLMRDIARATSAAPTYFEPAAVHSIGGSLLHLIDGGMFAGNPTLCALVEAGKTRFEACDPPTLSDVYVVSVGTGKERKHYDYEKAKNWGAIGWARPVIDILLSASAEVVDYQLQKQFQTAGCPDHYVRLEPELGKAKAEMDDASDENIRHLKEAGQNYIEEYAEALDAIVDTLIANNASARAESAVKKGKKKGGAVITN